MTARSGGNWQGMNWIRQEKRLAIYLRDGCACAYCGAGIEDGAILSLDHVKPHSKGGSNEASNLVTACKRCNDSRGNRGLRKFCAAVAVYLNHDADPAEIERHVRACTKRTLETYYREAVLLVSRRGSAAKAMVNLKRS